MRIFLAIPLLALSACGVDHDTANDQVTLQYNEEEIQQTAEDAGNTAEGIGAAIANEAEDAAAKIQNTDVDVNVNTGDGGNPPANQQ